MSEPHMLNPPFKLAPMFELKPLHFPITLLPDVVVRGESGWLAWDEAEAMLAGVVAATEKA